MIKMVASDLDGTLLDRWKTDAAGRDFSAGKGTEKKWESSLWQPVADSMPI